MSEPRAANVTLVSASAGTGKTHRLTDTVVRAIVDGNARPEGVVAISYTVRAAAELAGRIRRRLMQQGRWDAATRISDGYLGTIHAVAHRLLREFPLEAGVSPDLALLDEVGKQQLFGEAMDAAIDEHGTVADIAHRMGTEGTWVNTVRDLVQSARANAIDSAGLRACGADSVQEMLTLLGPEQPLPDGWEADLVASLAPILGYLRKRSSGADTKRNQRALAIQRDLPLGRAKWIDIDILADELSGLRGLDAIAAPFVKLAMLHRDHPRFRADVAGLTRGMFDVAADVYDAYELRKRNNRAIDYDDMLVGALRLLERSDVASEVGHRLDLVVVDEFQDVSPLQLAIVMRLAEVCGNATWVGDTKQAIFGFQGSDPQLMRAAIRTMTTGPLEVLDVSRRSRPGLVRLVSDVFVPVLSRFGHTPEQVRLGAVRDDPPALATEPVAELWGLTEAKGTHTNREADGIAEGIANSLRDGTLVHDGATVRPARPGDFAVLLRAGYRCEAVAERLRRRGIPVRVKLSGLLSSAEVRLVRAGLGILADPRMAVPAMELAWLSGSADTDPDAWLLAASQKKDGKDAFSDDPLVATLRDIAHTRRHLDPAEAVDRVIVESRVLERCARWPEPERRLANVEALRAEVRAYVTECELARRACTVAGLVAHLDALEGRARAGKFRDPRAFAGNEQALPSAEDAVTVSTWHAAKGLEWRIVVLGSLGWDREETLFGHGVEPAAQFDAHRPLAGRRLRYWPNPYPGRTDTVIGARAAQLPAAQRFARSRVEEELRLLYVGFTRPRDRVVFAVCKPDTKADDAWLGTLTDAEGRQVLRLPYDAIGTAADLADIVLTDGTRIPCKVRTIRPRSVVPADLPARTALFAPFASEARPPQVIHPSSVDLTGLAEVRVRPAHAMDGRVRIDAPVHRMDDVGNAIHAFLLSDDPAAPVTTRRERASRALAAFDVRGMAATDDLLKNGDALFRHLTSEYGKAKWLREWPVRWSLPDGRVLVGEIDLLLDLGDGYVVIDHKSFPGSAGERDERVRHHAGQLAAYRAAVEQATGKPVRHLLIHFPARGELQEVAVPKDAFRRWLSGPHTPEALVVAEPEPPLPAPPEPVAEPETPRTRRKSAAEPVPPEQLGLPFGPRR